MICRPLGAIEAAQNAGMTHVANVTADDLSNATAAAAQTILIANLANGDTILRVEWELKTAFRDVSDTAFNTTTMSVGDTAGVASYIAATELNENGTEVFRAFTNTPRSITTADKIAVTFNSMAAKSLVNIDVGEVLIFFQLYRPITLRDASGGAILTVPKP